MGRYNIPKQDSKQLIKEIRNSSNGDGGEDCEHYYKIINSDKFNNEMLKQYVLTGIINKVDTYNIEYNISMNYYGVIDLLYKDINVDTLAFKISNTAIGYFNSSQNPSYTRLPKGSIETKFKTLGQLSGMSDKDIEEMINALHQIFIPITKEEYESLITYKPE